MNHTIYKNEKYLSSQILSCILVGFDLFRISLQKESLYKSTYQHMGYMKKETLIILSPKKKS